MESEPVASTSVAASSETPAAVSSSPNVISLETAVANSGPLRRVRLPEDASAANMMELWTQQDAYVCQVENRMKELEQKARDSSRKESMLRFSLIRKESELSELHAVAAQLKRQATPSDHAQLKNVLVDPAINIIIQKLTKELEDTKKKMQETQEELAAWKFTPDSGTGKRLMSKCRQLLLENEEIGKMIDSGRLAKLEGELAMQKTLCDEMRKNATEMDDFVQELDTDMEGMQSTILLLQTQLKEARETINGLEVKVKQQQSETPKLEPELASDQPTSVVSPSPVSEALKADPDPDHDDSAQMDCSLEQETKVEAEEAASTQASAPAPCGAEAEEAGSSSAEAAPRTPSKRGRRARGSTTPTTAGTASASKDSSSRRGRSAGLKRDPSLDEDAAKTRPRASKRTRNNTDETVEDDATANVESESPQA